MSAGLIELLSTWYYVSDPNSYVIISGIGITDMKVIKSGFKFPLQNATVIDIRPINFEFKLTAMSIEKLSFTLPASFTIGPNLTKSGALTNEDIDNLRLYSRYLANSHRVERDHVIESIIGGEVRLSAGLLKIEDIFNDRIKFKSTIIHDVNEELKQFGLKVLNSNIKELSDSEGSHYFKNMQTKILSLSENQAKIDISTTMLKGETESKQNDTERELKVSQLNSKCSTGVKENEVTMKIELSKLESDKTLGENLQNETMVKSNAKLSIIKLEQDKLINTSKVQTEQEVQMIKIKLEKEIEFVSIELEEKNNKAKFKSNIEQIKSKKLAETTVEADSIKIQTDANFYQKQKEAEGIQLLYKAQAEGLKELKNMFGDNESLLKYLMIKDNQLTKLAEINGKAIQGLNPKITIWNTSTNEENNGGFTNVISNIIKSVPPLLSTVEDQTGIKMFQSMVDTSKKE